MDSVIRRILDIDQKTAKLVRETKTRLSQNDEMVASLLEIKEQELKEETKRESDACHDRIMQEAQALVEQMEKENKEHLGRMYILYQKNKDQLAEEMLNKLLDA